MTFYQGWDGPKVYAAQLGEPVQLDLTMPAPQVGIVPLRPLDLSDILGGAFKAVRFNPVVMLGLTTLIVLITQLLGSLAAAALGPSADGLVPQGELEAVGLSGSVLLGSAASQLAIVVVNMGLMYATAQAVRAVRVRPADALRQMGRRLGPALALMALLTVFSAIPLAAMIAGFGASTTSGEVEAAVGVALLLFLVAVPVAIWLSIKWSFAPCLITIENLGPIRALRRSWDLTRGLFWRVLGITMLVNLVVGIAAGTVTQAFSFGAMLLTIGEQPQAMLVVLTASTVISTALTVPLTSAATTLLYLDARIRREGFDIILSEEMYR